MTGRGTHLCEVAEAWDKVNLGAERLGKTTLGQDVHVLRDRNGEANMTETLCGRTGSWIWALGRAPDIGVGDCCWTCLLRAAARIDKGAGE